MKVISPTSVTSNHSLRNGVPARKPLIYHLLAVAICGAVLFIPFLGGVHLFDWDEINFAEAAREMLVTGQYSRVTIDYQPFWEKPPLFFWLQAASMKIFGINEFAARFPNAVCGIITLCFIFILGRSYFDTTFGWLWVLAYIGSFLPHFYFKTGIIDPWFNLFIFSAIMLLMTTRYTIAGIFTGLAILTKGPVALLVVALTAIIFALTKKEALPGIKSIAIFFASTLLVSSLWFGLEVVQNGTEFIREFILYQSQLFSTRVAGHGGPFYYHAMVLLVGCFPVSVIALGGFFKKHDSEQRQQNFRLRMIILFGVVLILFSIVKTKIIHYSSLCYLPLTFLAAWEIYFRMKNALKLPKMVVALLLSLGILLGLAATILPCFGMHPDLILPYIKDSFAKANLQANVRWNWSLMLIGIFYCGVCMVSVLRLSKSLLPSIVVLFVSTCIFLEATLIAFVPRIESHTQRAAIEFYKTLAGKDVYVDVLGFKSYAHLFYSKKSPPQNPKSRDKDWLLNGEIDKPVYFVSKVTKAEEYGKLLQLKEIGRKNGFVFFERTPK